MIKSIITNSLSNGGLTAISNVDCSQLNSCGSCIAQRGCGFCGNINSCVSGGWFGAFDRSNCGLNDYYFHQCHLSTLPLGILSIILIAIIVIATIVGLSILCCCFCCKCCQREDLEGEDDENRPLLGSRYLRRSSTYYQWNRQPINKPNHTKNTKLASSVAVDQVGDAAPLPDSSSTTAESWENRRSALLKKYTREPALPDE